MASKYIKYSWKECTQWWPNSLRLILLRCATLCKLSGQRVRDIAQRIEARAARLWNYTAKISTFFLRFCRKVSTPRGSLVRRMKGCGSGNKRRDYSLLRRNRDLCAQKRLVATSKLFELTTRNLQRDLIWACLPSYGILQRNTCGSACLLAFHRTFGDFGILARKKLWHRVTEILHADDVIYPEIQRNYSHIELLNIFPSQIIFIAMNCAVVNLRNKF